MNHARTWSLILLQFVLFSTGKADCSMPELAATFLMSEKSILHNSFPENIEVFLQCANGYERESGSASIICTGGTWSAVELICKKMDCGEPRTSPHMSYIIKDGTLFGAYVKPKCERGYYLEGSSYRQCLVTGWSGKSSCSLITCEKPSEIKHGKIVTALKTDEPLLDDVIEYSCDANYVLVGNRSITCNEEGEYSSPPPTCKAIECPVPEVQFGKQTQGNPPYSYKSEATFECEPAYSMKGLPTAVCEERGWTALPVCVEDIKQQTEAKMITNIPTTTSSLYGQGFIPTTTSSLYGQGFIPTTTSSLYGEKFIPTTTSSLYGQGFIPTTTSSLYGEKFIPTTTSSLYGTAVSVTAVCFLRQTTGPLL